jgi:hypothetical protein
MRFFGMVNIAPPIFTKHFPSGYIIVLGFGAMFSVVTTLVTVADKYFGGLNMTSEQFK